MMKTKRKSNKWIFLLLLIVLLIFIGFFVLINQIFNYRSLSQNENKLNHVLVTIVDDNKQNLKELMDRGVIKNDYVTYLYLRFFKKDFSFYKGNFEIPANLKLDEVLDYLGDQSNIIQEKTVTLTFIEGDWAKHIARKISENTNVSYDELIDYWNNKDIYDSLSKTYPFLANRNQENVKILLEGYLFPNTYEFYRETTKEDVTTKLLNETQRIYEKYQNEIKNASLSFHELMTLASIVQYESGNISEMPTVASVFYNRLAINMRLESSVTRCYVIGFEKGDDWRDCEKNLDYYDPYDTYESEGLPPGPILNPGEEAFKAVIMPNKTDYLFFVGDLDKHNHFARTLQEHEQNICKYLTKSCQAQ